MTTLPSPYAGKPEREWNRITRRLLAAHPLDLETILEVAQPAWQSVWTTVLGSGGVATRLVDLDVPASIVGYFFEILFTKEMERRYPGKWRPGQRADEKDLVYVPDPARSVELKASGQPGYKVFGNRSYGQSAQEGERTKKNKSGYY